MAKSKSQEKREEVQAEEAVPAYISNPCANCGGTGLINQLKVCDLCQGTGVKK